MAVPAIHFVNQTPTDIDTFNVFNAPLNITYNITDPLGINPSSVGLNYKTNSSTLDTSIYVNGTPRSGWTINGDANISNSSEIWQFLLQNDEVYPATYNFDEDNMTNTPKSVYDLDEGDEYVKVQLLNVSNAKNYSFFEIYADNQTTASNTLRVYYCNSSYATGNPATNNNCVLIYDLARTEPFNHTHSAYSKHHVIPFTINTTSGNVGGAGGAKVTPISYFLLRGRLGVNSWNVYYITNVSRNDAIQFTTNGGVAWSNLSGTVDAHLHQYDGSETFRYYACANSSGDGSGNCSAERYDLIELAGLLPDPPMVYSPAEDAAYNSSISINYTAAVSPNGYEISFYNISLYNSDDTFNSTIIANNSANLSYLWDPVGVADGEYMIAVEACDVLGQCSTGLSGLFNLDTILPSISIQAPLSIVYRSIPIGLNYTVSEVNLDSCWYELDGSAAVPLPGCLNSSVSPGNGVHFLELFANDTAGNVNSSNVTFTASAPSSAPPSPGDEDMDVGWERACPGNLIIISASDGGEPLEGVDVRIVLREPNAGQIGEGTTDADGSITFNASINGTYNAYFELSGYTYDNPLAFAYTTCPQEETATLACKTNADCALSEYCGMGVCAPVECACGIVSNHECDAYECCSDSECSAGFACAGNECVETPGQAPIIQPPVSGAEPGSQQPSGGSQPPVSGTQPECTINADCAPGFGCEGGSCISIQGTPAAGTDGTPLPGVVGERQPSASGELPLPWWVIPEAMAFGALTFAAGAYSMHWWINRKK
jgi:hypothetical protein